MISACSNPLTINAAWSPTGPYGLGAIISANCPGGSVSAECFGGFYGWLYDTGLFDKCELGIYSFQTNFALRKKSQRVNYTVSVDRKPSQNSRTL